MYLKLCIVEEGVCVCREACRFTGISFHVRRVSKWHLKGCARWFAAFVCCVEVSPDLDCLGAVQRRSHLLQL